ncbi:membrane protein insertase YidC [Endozoicomonas sp. 8E]|uniref:membrane protein insertase YidC n=1 Tax=Endozoicomonas sp. 8E TaxID=3035692 RepID=UPI0029392DBF|nr:membrane protein insertase YidC [Endozoicomonas sp. 8E]WOG28079.1 membrane protein insertase YidC [Endozoicomonas sp. 8E]
MDLQRTLLIGAIAVVGVFTLQQWNEDYNQTRPTSDAVVANVSTSQSGSDLPTISPSSSSPEILDDKVQTSAQLINVKTDTLNLQIDPVGGDIIGLSLPKYPAWLPEEGEKATPFQLLVNRPDCTPGEVTCVYTAQSGLIATDGPTNDQNQRPLYSTAQTSYTLPTGQDQLMVKLTRSAGDVQVTKSYTFKRGSYEVELAYEIANNSDKVWRDPFYAQLKRDGSEDPSSVNSSAPMNTYLGAAVRSIDEPYRKLPFDDFQKEPFKERVEGGYAAILQHYFVSAWVPAQDKPHNYYTQESRNNEYYRVGFYNDPLVVNPGEKAITGATLYAGPKDQPALKNLADGLQLTMDFGMLWFLAQPLFKLLQFIHSLVGNWGWAIILLTVCVKAVFYPLNQASFRSMAKMRKLGPKMQELKERFGDDRQKMSQAMMEMYKKEKVNPMGGCLPILVQMPVFIALYWVLQEAVELRQAPWLGWIKDLSQMDPYFILPLIMGASMFVQQMLNPTPPDPVQAKVMKLMPLIFTVFFLWFPAGLVLYWVTNNILSIIQQYIITRKIEKEDS